MMPDDTGGFQRCVRGARMLALHSLFRGIFYPSWAAQSSQEAKPVFPGSGCTL